MDDLLLVKTFTLLGGMLIITTIFSRINKAYETTTEAVITVFGVFLFFFLSLFYADQYPYNIIFVGIFSGFIGWDMGTLIAFIGEKFKFRKYLKAIGVKSQYLDRGTHYPIKSN